MISTQFLDIPIYIVQGALIWFMNLVNEFAANELDLDPEMSIRDSRYKVTRDVCQKKFASTTKLSGFVE